MPPALRPQRPRRDVSAVVEKPGFAERFAWRRKNRPSTSKVVVLRLRIGQDRVGDGHDQVTDNFAN
jgi:hypothetical protein